MSSAGGRGPPRREAGSGAVDATPGELVGALIALAVGSLLTAAMLARWFARDAHGYC